MFRELEYIFLAQKLVVTDLQAKIWWKIIMDLCIRKIFRPNKFLSVQVITFPEDLTI